jgi:hypothetical protein
MDKLTKFLPMTGGRKEAHDEGITSVFADTSQSQPGEDASRTSYDFGMSGAMRARIGSLNFGFGFRAVGTLVRADSNR